MRAKKWGCVAPMINAKALQSSNHHLQGITRFLNNLFDFCKCSHLVGLSGVGFLDGPVFRSHKTDNPIAFGSRFDQLDGSPDPHNQGEYGIGVGHGIP